MRLTSTLDEAELTDLVKTALHFKYGTKYSVTSVRFTATESRDAMDRLTAGHDVSCVVELQPINTEE